MTERESSKNIINCTGHTLHIYEGGRKVRTLPADTDQIRIKWVDQDDFDLDGLTVVEFSHGAIGLPPVEAGVWYVVSYVTALGLLLAGVDRPDVLTPGPKVSGQGRTMGCRGLRRVVR